MLKIYFCYNGYKLLRNIGFFIFGLLIVSSIGINAQNNHEEMFIETLNDNETYDISGGNCVPGNIIITIKSNLGNLVFDSNVSDIEQPIFDKNKQEYVFCHSNESFYLNISTPGYISKEIYIDAVNPKYGFKITSTLPKGKILINTNPKNALVDFGLSGIAPQLAGNIPFELNVGKYFATISKSGYSTTNQEITVSSDESENSISINLKPQFSKIQLDISTEDKKRFVVLPIINIDTAYINMADLYDVTKIKSFDSPAKLEYYKIYEGGFVPLPEGRHNIIINAPGFKTFSKEIFTVSGASTPLSVKMKPVSGYLTIIDQKNSEGAEVYIDDEKVSVVPTYNLITKIGEHKVKVIKGGYLADNVYKVSIREDSITDLYVSMSQFKEIKITSDPESAEVFVNNTRQGFTPANIILLEGKNEISIRKIGFLAYNQTITIEKDMFPISDFLSVSLRKSYPLTINTEENVLAIVLENGNEIAKGNVPGIIDIPYGKYSLELYNNNKLRYSGKFTHNGENKVNAPLYSSGTFTTLVFDYYYQKNPVETIIDTRTNNIFNLFAKGQFGRFKFIIPGLSTSMINASIYNVNELYMNKSIEINNSTFEINDDYVFALSCLFLNGEYRAGGSIFKNLDINFVGSYVWYPNLSKLIPINHITGTDTFYGIEIGTRISGFNINTKIGKKAIKENFNYNKSQTANSTSTANQNYIVVPMTYEGFIISIGFTLGQKISRSNNMLRLWKKPMVSSY